MLFKIIKISMSRVKKAKPKY